MPVATKPEVDTTALDTTLAERYVRDHLDCSYHRAERLVAAFDASVERKDGLRRVVLTGRWEVDPAARSAP